MVRVGFARLERLAPDCERLVWPGDEAKNGNWRVGVLDSGGRAGLGIAVEVPAVGNSEREPAVDERDAVLRRARDHAGQLGAVHAFQTSLLTAIALGSPLEYEAFNPIYPFYLARGGNVAGGLDIFTTAEWANEKGFYPVSLVGSDNLHVDSGKTKEYADDALRYQSGIVYIEGDYETKIVKACRALCSVCFGSGRYFTDSRTDSNGIKVMAHVGYGGHAQCFTGWREVDGEEYIFNQNSWGDAYGQSAEGEPGSGSWLGEEERSVYWRDLDNYGHPYLVFVEGDLRREGALYNDFALPNYPAEWIACN